MFLDHASTTRPLPEVAEAVARTQIEWFGNPSSQHEPGRGGAPRREDAREFLRGTLCAAQLVFTSGGTEADLLGVFGAALGRSPGRILVGAADHPAVLAQAPLLERSGHRMQRVPVTPNGDIDPEALFDVSGSDVRVVSILHGHNELGTLARLADLVEIVRRVSPTAHVHVDLVQSYGKIPFDLDAADVDSVAVSGHKLHGPRGVGFLALSSKARIEPLATGGGQEGGLRGGTENLPGIVGLQVAAEQMLTHMADADARMRAFAAQVIGVLEARLGDVRRLGHPDRSLPHVLPLRIPGVVGETLQQRCAARGVAFSTGAACHDGKHAANPVHEAIGLARRQSREVIRLSFSSHDDAVAIDAAAHVIADEAEILLRTAPPREAGRR
jgi:cysteine desulfurase